MCVCDGQVGRRDLDSEKQLKAGGAPCCRFVRCCGAGKERKVAQREAWSLLALSLSLYLTHTHTHTRNPTQLQEWHPVYPA